VPLTHFNSLHCVPTNEVYNANRVCNRRFDFIRLNQEHSAFSCTL